MRKRWQFWPFIVFWIFSAYSCSWHHKFVEDISQTNCFTTVLKALIRICHSRSVYKKWLSSVITTCCSKRLAGIFADGVVHFSRIWESSKGICQSMHLFIADFITYSMRHFFLVKTGIHSSQTTRVQHANFLHQNPHYLRYVEIDQGYSSI